jgi:hypothetical protein
MRIGSTRIKQTLNAQRSTSNVQCRQQTLTIMVVLWVGLSSIALAQNNRDELKQRILAQAKGVSPDDYAFTRTVRSEQTSNGKTEKHVNVEKFDPAKLPDARWTLVSVDGAPPSTDALKEFKTDSSKRRVPGYYRLAGYFGTPATATTDSDGWTVFRFTTLPKDTVKVMDTDVAQNTTAEASVADANGTPFVEQVHFTVRPMRLKLIMKLEGYQSTARYQMGSEGKPLLMEQTSDMSGSGLGKEGKAHTVTTYSDYRAVGKQR